MNNGEVQVGTGVIIVKDRKVLVGRRKGSHAAGLYSFPGGHLDFGETWDQCVLREIAEECGEHFKAVIRPYSKNRLEYFITNDIMPQYGKHYITIFVVADWKEGEPVNCEPHKCEGWEWMTFEELAQLAQHKEVANWIPMPLMHEYREKMGL